MAPPELVALGLALEALERAEGGSTDRPRPTANHPEEKTGTTREIVASALGISATSYERARGPAVSAGGRDRIDSDLGLVIPTD